MPILGSVPFLSQLKYIYFIGQTWLSENIYAVCGGGGGGWFINIAHNVLDSEQH